MLVNSLHIACLCQIRNSGVIETPYRISISLWNNLQLKIHDQSIEILCYKNFTPYMTTKHRKIRKILINLTAIYAEKFRIISDNWLNFSFGAGERNAHIFESKSKSIGTKNDRYSGRQMEILIQFYFLEWQIMSKTKGQSFSTFISALHIFLRQRFT